MIDTICILISLLLGAAGAVIATIGEIGVRVCGGLIDTGEAVIRFSFRFDFR